MADDRERLVAGIFDAWNRGDVEAVVAAFHPECVIEGALNRGNDPYVGHDGVRRWLGEIAEVFGTFQIVPLEIRSTPAGALALCRLLAEGRSSGAVLDQPAGYVADFEDELLTRLVIYLDHDQARRAAGR